MNAYTYLVIHKPSGKMYYGCRKSSTFDLWTKYFTSSKIIKRLILEDGANAFTVTLRRKFNSYEAARKWETKFLKKVKVPSNPLFFNQAISAPAIPLKNAISEAARRKAISHAMKL